MKKNKELKIFIHLGPKELKAAIGALINVPANERIPLKDFKKNIPISYRNANAVIDWLRERGYLVSQIIEKCGTAKEEIYIAWTVKGRNLKKKHSQDIAKILDDLNEEEGSN